MPQLISSHTTASRTKFLILIFAGGFLSPTASGRTVIVTVESMDDIVEEDERLRVVPHCA